MTTVKSVVALGWVAMAMFGCTPRTQPKAALIQSNFPDLSVIEPSTTCPYWQFSYTGRNDTMVKGICSVQPEFNQDSFVSGKWRDLGLDAGDLPDVTINAAGWLYMTGSKFSAGTQSHGIGATSTKLIVDTTVDEDAFASPTTPRLLHVSQPVSANAKSWKVDAFVNWPVVKGKTRRGTSTAMTDPATDIGATDAIVATVRQACADCNWPPEDRP